MRISASDPEWNEGKYNRVRIWLDGREQVNVIMADNEKGEILRYVSDRKGCPCVAEDGKSLKRETVKGKVKIKL